MIIDSHVHAFPKDIRKYREKYFDGEPAFQLLYDSPKSRLVSAKDIVGTMDTAGVDKSVIFGFPWRNEDFFKANNDYIIDAVSRYPDRLTGFCCLDPGHPGALMEVVRCLDAGLSGIGELAFYESGIDAKCIAALDPVMAVCAERNVPVMIHTNEPVGHIYPGKTPNTLAQIYSMLKRFAANRIILAHWGGGIFLYSLMKKEVRETLKNTWFDTAASPFLYDPRIYRLAVDLLGPKKILFGTDYPLLRPQRYFSDMDAAGLNAEEKAAVCGESAAALLGL